MECFCDRLQIFKNLSCEPVPLNTNDFGSTQKNDGHQTQKYV